jgi:hypothetical protein
MIAKYHGILQILSTAPPSRLAAFAGSEIRKFRRERVLQPRISFVIAEKEHPVAFVLRPAGRMDRHKRKPSRAAGRRHFGDHFDERKIVEHLRCHIKLSFVKMRSDTIGNIARSLSIFSG